MTPLLVDRLHASVQRFPDRPAVVAGQRRISFAVLWENIRKVACLLRERGLAPGERVALLLENSPEYVAAYYGVLAAGGVAVALNTAAKANDLRNWLQHCDATCLIAAANHAELEAVLSSYHATRGVVRVAAVNEENVWGWDEQLLDAPAAAGAVVRGMPEQAATIIYTSGTTGAPKGVTLSQRNLSSNVASILEYLDLRDTDRIVNVLPFYYSYGNSVLHTHLAVGGCVILENSLAYPHAVLQRMVDERVTGFSGVPSTFALLLSRVKLEQYDLTTLRYLTQAGGPMSPAHMRRLRHALPHARLFVMYGQTEATARISYLPPEKLDAKLGSVGIPIPGVEVQIRDEGDREVAPGQTGEICVRGANVMLGYWKDPQETARVLIGGWLHTGDVAYRDEDGCIFIVGRRSDMIKTGAHRVSPKEIEEVIAELEGVAEVSVVGIADEILGEVVKAVIAPCTGYELDKRSVQAHCHARLALYKVPKHVEFVATLPKTASGKIKRHLLKESGNQPG